MSLLLNRGIYMPVGGLQDVCLYSYEPGDCWCEIDGLGYAIRHSDGKTSLIGPSPKPHPFESGPLEPLPWRAACA